MATELREQKMVEERMKSSEERQLDRFVEDNRQEMIKRDLKKFQDARKGNMLNSPNIFKHKNIFTNQPHMFGLKNNLNSKGMFFNG